MLAGAEIRLYLNKAELDGRGMSEQDAWDLAMQHAHDYLPQVLSCSQGEVGVRMG